MNNPVSLPRASSSSCTDVRAPLLAALRRRGVAVLVLGVVLLFVACGGAPEEGSDPSDSLATSSEPAAAPVPAAGYNLLLITLDTLRADRLGTYGYEPAATPNIDRLAAEGVRFERVTTTVPVTLPAHASIMTGLPPFEHGVRNNGAFVLGESAVTLAEVLRDAGYATGGFIGAVVLESQFGIAQGFDHFDGLALYQARSGDRSGERPAAAVVEAAGAWLAQRAAPWFAWVHLYDPHDPYEPPEPFAGRLDDPYDGEIAYVDAMIGELLAVLENNGAAERTLVVLTADHGEGLGEHGERTHAFFVYDSTVRVPLILWAGEALPAGTVAIGAASVVDVFPTALSLLGLADRDPRGVVGEGATTESGGTGVPAATGRMTEPAATDGTNPPPGTGVDLSDRIWLPDAQGRPAYAESLIPYLDFGWSELRALVDDGRKYIAAPEPELYDLAADPGENDNLVDVDVARADAMAARLASLTAADDVTEVGGGTLDAGDVAALQALGYLAGGGTRRARRDIDPKDMIDTYEAFVDGLRDAAVAIDEERYGDANEILVRLDALLPDQYAVHYYFGRLALAAGDPATAVDVLERALELEPSYLPTYTQLANALHAAGRGGEARALLDRAREMFPANFSLTLLQGAIAHDSGDLQAALTAYRDAGRLQPDNPELLERLGHLHLLRQQPAEAVAALQRLVERTPERAGAWAQLAVARAQAGDIDAARAALDRAVALDPADPFVRQVLDQLR